MYRFVYFGVFLFVIVGQGKTELTHPCSFNPQCQCSSGSADFGSVLCENVPFADIPLELQEARVVKLQLRNNGLHRLADSKLFSTGLWKLEVSHNQISSISSMAFHGLERVLWELHLNNNKLTRIPAESISLLKKLTVLNLADNFVSDLRREDLHSLSSSLRVLDLSGNCLTSVPEAIFWDLHRLDTLDLSKNNIIQIHSMAFQNGVQMLSDLNLADNLLGKIPFVSISHIKSLKRLDLSNNRIEKIEDPFFQSTGLKLDKLILRENNIENLSTRSFMNFDVINFTSLAGNPLRNVDAEGFLDAKIKVLDLSNCFISSLSSRAFKGLERTLEELKLNANRLKQIPDDLFEDFDLIRNIEMENNMLTFSPNSTFSGFAYTLRDLDLSGQDMGEIQMQEVGSLRNLRTVSLPPIKSPGHILQTKFQDFPPGLEELRIVNAGLRTIGKHSFAHIPSVSYMDLSNNKIERIDDDAFKDVGNALHTLILSNALHFTKLPAPVFQSLTGLKTLDLSNNHLREIPVDTFHKMANLEHLYLQDNQISTLHRGTFHIQANSELKILDLSFNKISSIPNEFFSFPNLESLILDDNLIKELTPKSFTDMHHLVYLSLEGNLLTQIPNETFQNLHRLSSINLAYNKIKQVDFAAFDSVGIMLPLSIDFSHNQLQDLGVNKSNMYTRTSDIASLDFSYNNISIVDESFFKPLQNSLKLLNMSRNCLREVSRETFSHLRRLHMVDLSFNSLSSLDSGLFISSSKLRSIYLKANQLTTLSPALFANNKQLTDVDLSWNYFESLPELLFQRTNLEILNVGHNKLTEIPIKSLNSVQATLKHLNLAGNNIATVSESQLSQIQSLVALNLADNQISTVDNLAFCCIPNLLWLNLASNPLLKISPDVFTGVKSQLEVLNIANTSITLMPNLQLPHLKVLNISHNQLTFVASKTLANLSEVRQLDLSHNELPAPPSSAWHYMHHLRDLNLAGNPIIKVANDSFLGLERLERLDISNIQATTYQTGCFSTVPNLRHLKISIDDKVEDLKLANLLSDNSALESLHLNIESFDVAAKKKSSGSGSNPNFADGEGVLRHELQDVLPLRLKKIVIEGKNIKNIHPAAFKHVRSRRLDLIIRAEESAFVDRDIFLNLGRVQNLSIDISRPLLDDEHLARLRSDQLQDSASDPSSLRKEKRITFPPSPEGLPFHLGNPVTTYNPNQPRGVFLHDLKISGVQWKCSCEGIGWVEKWLRRWRTVFCGHAAHIGQQVGRVDVTTGLGSVSDRCKQTVRDIRQAFCERKSNLKVPISVMDDLKSNLECEAFNSASKISSGAIILGFVGIHLVSKLFLNV